MVGRAYRESILSWREGRLSGYSSAKLSYPDFPMFGESREHQSHHVPSLELA